MKGLTESAACRKLCEGFEALCRYSVGIDHDTKLSLYADSTAQTPLYSCRWQGSGRKGLWLCLATVSAAALAIALLRRLCSLISD